MSLYVLHQPEELQSFFSLIGNFPSLLFCFLFSSMLMFVSIELLITDMQRDWTSLFHIFLFQPLFPQSGFYIWHALIQKLNWLEVLRAMLEIFLNYNYPQLALLVASLVCLHCSLQHLYCVGCEGVCIVLHCLEIWSKQYL